MREKFNHLYLDSHERKLLIHSLVELKNQLIQQGRYTDCVDELIFKVINGGHPFPYAFYLFCICIFWGSVVPAGLSAQPL